MSQISDIIPDLIPPEDPDPTVDFFDLLASFDPSTLSTRQLNLIAESRPDLSAYPGGHRRGALSLTARRTKALQELNSCVQALQLHVTVWNERHLKTRYRSARKVFAECVRLKTLLYIIALQEGGASIPDKPQALTDWEEFLEHRETTLAATEEERPREEKLKFVVEYLQENDEELDLVYEALKHYSSSSE